MAENEAGEKTEEPTPEKLRKAREKGQVSKSRDAASALSFIGAFLALFVSATFIAQMSMNLIRASFQAAAAKDLQVSIEGVLANGLWVWLLISLPAACAAFLFGFAGNYFQIGFLLASDPIKPDLKKINSITGFKQLFSKDRLVELIKQIIKFVAVSAVVYTAVRDQLRNIVLTERMDLGASVAVGAELIKDIGIRVAVLFLVIAAADYFWQRFSFLKKMRMTKYEVKQEYKQSEGDPELKGERKRLAYEILFHGSTEQVKNADAVVTNPAHLAIAIKYDQKEHTAPHVVAKGVRKNAETILALARQYDVPVLRNVPLAHALQQIDVDAEIPEDLYEAVAEVLNFVYELKKS